MQLRRIIAKICLFIEITFCAGATEMDFFEIGKGNYMTIASKPHIPFLWRIFLRLSSTSSCCLAFGLNTLYNKSTCLIIFIIFQTQIFGKNYLNGII